MATSTIQTRVETSLKEKAESLFSSMGLDLTSAIRLFLTQSVEQRKIPFEIKAPQNFSFDDVKWEDLSQETKAAFNETRDIASGKIKTVTYDTAEDLIKDALCADDIPEYKA